MKEAGLGQVGDRIMNIRGQDQNKKEAGPGQEGGRTRTRRRLDWNK